MKLTYLAAFLVWALNTMLLLLWAPLWWLGALAAALSAAAVVWWRHVHPPAARDLRELLRGIVPAWNGNVQLARTQTQEAIDQLTLRFVGIHERLGDALNLVERGKKGDLLRVIQHAAEQLSGIATVLEQVLATRQALLGKMDMLARQNQEIRQLVQDLGQLEHHAESGVADLFSDQTDWPVLVRRATDSGRQILAKANAMQTHIQSALSSASPADTDVARMIEDSRAVIDGVITEFRQSALKLSNTVDQLEQENREVDQEVCDILVNLQFQDRIGQMLNQVQRDMSKLEQLLHSSPDRAVPAPASWLAELERTYTTEEQRQVHAGQQATKAAQSQVDFF